ncbi:MAG: hypothetical protein MUF25_09465, partial [Pirellulaceae bacterium]|nr:hypothetical protein [Pirellulaceae bacterium]
VAAPTKCAASSFLLCLAAEVIGRRAPSERAGSEDERLMFLGRLALPLKDRLPLLYARPLSAGALPLSLLGLLISATLILRGDLTNSACLGAAVSALVLALITRTYRFRWLLALSILAGYFAAHSAILKFFFSDWSPADSLTGHLVVAAAISLLGWTIATGYSAWCEFWLKRVAEAKEAPIRQWHVFYSGMLHHVTLAVATATLGVLVVVSLGLYGDGRPVLQLAAALLLAAFFGLAGAVYRSKLGSYPCYGLAAIFAARGIRVPPAAAFGILALVLGLISWLLLRYLRASPKSRPEFGMGIVPTAWDRAPLPLYATGAELWAGPLAQASILLGFLAVAQAVVSWDGSEPVLSLAAIYLAATVWLLGTGTRRLGVFRLLTLEIGGHRPAGPEAAGRQQRADHIERIALYVLGIGTVYFAVHATAQALYLRSAADSEVISWHILLAASISLVGWTIATSYSAWCNARLARVAQEVEQPLRDRLAFYAGWLHHVIPALATFGLFALISTTVQENVRAAPPVHFLEGLLLAVFFGLSGAVYRTKLATYLALISLGLSALDIAAIIPLPWQLGGPADAAGLALLGLCAITIATGLWQAHRQPAGDSQQAAILPSPWIRSPLPFSESSLGQLWAGPLAELGLAFAGLSVLLVSIRWDMKEWVPVLATFYLAAAILILAARLYRTPVLTYLAAGSLWASLYPLLAVMIASHPYVHSGTAVAALSLALWEQASSQSAESTR